MASSMVNSTSETYRVSSSANQRPVSAILVGGLIVGVLDLVYAIVVYRPKNPIRIPQSVASGVLGMNSFQMGNRSAALGVVLHFVIALGAAAVYYFASRKLPFLTTHAVLSGLVFGALVYGFMHVVVLPLSAVPQAHGPLIYKVAEFMEHWFFVGLPIAFSVRHFSPARVRGK